MSEIRKSESKLNRVTAVGACLVLIWSLFALAYAIGTANGRQAERRETQRHAHASAAIENARRQCAGEIQHVIDCVYDKIEHSNELALVEQDLTAQQRAAWGAILNAIVAFAALITSALGIWFIYETLKATRATIAEAKAATALAVKTFDLTQDSTRKQLRAYISVSEVSFAIFNENHVKIQVKIVNLGLTPAKNIFATRMGWVGPRSVVDPHKSGPQPDPSGMSKIDLARDQVDCITKFVSDENRKKINSENTDFYIYGRIEYDDIFGVRHWVAYAYTPTTYTLRLENEFVPCIGGNASS